MEPNIQDNQGDVDSGLPEGMQIVPDQNPLQSVNAEDVNESNEHAYDLNRIDSIVSLLKFGNDELIKKEINKHILGLMSKDEFCKLYNVVFLFDVVNSISRVHAEKIYSSIQGFEERKDIILFLRSRGGKVEPSYLISQLCNKFKRNKFIVSIPAEAKSAATLLSFGADEIHMGPMSELGPIDLQVDGLPLQSISGALEKIAAIVQKFPESSDMFAKYLTDNLNIGLIGYYDRVSESASQYAQMLLKGKHDDNTRSVEEIAAHFTNHYKDHGFVIDVAESTSILGEYMVKDNTQIYKSGSKVLEFFTNIEFTFALLGQRKSIVFVGNSCEIMTGNSFLGGVKDEASFRNIKS
ncbi:hypothetical protein RAG50_27095 [Klebsiella pneumoniae]